MHHAETDDQKLDRLRKKEPVEREPYILNGDGWEPDEELSKGDAAQAIADFLWEELEAEKITITHKGEGCGIHLTVELSEKVTP